MALWQIYKDQFLMQFFFHSTTANRGFYHFRRIQKSDNVKLILKQFYCIRCFLWCNPSYNGSDLGVKKSQRSQVYLDSTLLTISGRVDRASVTEAVDSGSIPDRVKPKTIKIGIHSFLAWRSAIKGTVWSLRRGVVDRWAGGSLTRRPKDPFAVSWQSQLTWWIKCNYNYYHNFPLKVISADFSQPM